MLGGGGAARAIVYGLAGTVSHIDVIARRPDAVGWTAALAWSDATLRERLAGADLVVDTTPIGLNDHEPHGIPLDALPPTAWVSSLIYHRETALVRDAKFIHLQTHDGRAMLVHQGARAFSIWTGRPAPIEVMATALG